MLKIRKDVMSYVFYYFYNEDNCQTALDSEVAALIDVNVNEYREKMVKMYNAFTNANTNQIYFKNQSDAQDALDYIRSIMIEKLSQEK